MRQFLRNNLATVVAGAVVAAILVTALALLGPWRQVPATGLVALVHDGDGTTHTLSLDKDDQLTITTSLGSNTIVVEGGTVRVSAADCPNGSCTQQHPITRPGEQLICLPHRLWVEVAAPGDKGTGALDTDAVTWNDGTSTDQDGVDLVAR